MVRLIWLLPIFGALIGAFIMLATIGGSMSAPQEAAGYSMACAFAVVPYVLARAVMGMSEEQWQVDIKRVATALEKRPPPSIP